ncbi:MAG: C4-type zinc ribbon domain-containing protein [Endomicrobium sp.]|jgi:predicted  nucleic acid-binding Zn-ribbon protein|uniref:zinc ribbon domain-containing protein n=1 Tax=Candidatus Endomicrobiellum cubanum TaxID=3242325 RepID=UPI0028274D19|nr:C4-type zinc ribbon domain-containing protein [Endomicrobium sp.]MDR2395185.1 C4-type zinc ribbon domain-containing protein [Endomicrobium sp.]
MENLRQHLEMLYDLQSYDNKINNLNKQIQEAILDIERKKEDLQNRRTELDNIKRSFVEINSIKKEKEAFLNSKEELISRHSLELNTVKSNEVYKALLLEIEKIKADKSIIEDEILQLMDTVDKEALVIKNLEKDFQDFDSKIKRDILEIESLIENKKKEIAIVEVDRQKQESKINKSIFLQYERLREGRDGIGLVLVDGESCGACGMVLRPQLINQAQKAQELVFCDNCSRILFKK